MTSQNVDQMGDFKVSPVHRCGWIVAANQLGNCWINSRFFSGLVREHFRHQEPMKLQQLDTNILRRKVI